jgi:glyoxylase-like metal-dependent hydrolase (beta-lactamase superfamily II)
VHVLHNGYVGLDGDDERVSGTVTLILDGDAVIVVDPGTPDRTEDPLGADQAALASSRRLLLEFADVIIPGHGARFRPGTRA